MELKHCLSNPMDRLEEKNVPKKVLKRLSKMITFVKKKANIINEKKAKILDFQNE